MNWHKPQEPLLFRVYAIVHLLTSLFFIVCFVAYFCRLCSLFTFCNRQEFKYKTAAELQSLPSSATLDTYSGGGYVYKVRGSAKNIQVIMSLTKLSKLKIIIIVINSILLFVVSLVNILIIKCS